jgi:hypothetical protein
MFDLHEIEGGGNGLSSGWADLKTTALVGPEKREPRDIRAPETSGREPSMEDA